MPDKVNNVYFEDTFIILFGSFSVMEFSNSEKDKQLYHIH